MLHPLQAQRLVQGLKAVREFKEFKDNKDIDDKAMNVEEFRLENETAELPHKREYAEDKLQIACKAWYDAAYPKYRLLLHHSPNEGKLMMRDRDGAKRKAMGMRAGFPDFILLVPSGEWPYLCAELKSPKGRQTESQRLYQQVVEMSGGRYEIVRSLDEFRGLISDWMKQRKRI